MRNNKLILLILLLPSCMQPSVVVKPSNEIKSSVNQSIAPITPKIIESVNPVLSEIKESPIANIVVSSKPSVIESDGNLTSKITDAITIPTPSSTSTIYPNTQPLYSPIVNPTSNKKLTPCDIYLSNSPQCLEYHDIIKKLTTKEPYSEVNVVPDGLTSGHINITFKDQYKIRYKSSEGKFISLIGTDISSVNDLIITDKLSSTLYENTLSESIAQNGDDITSQNCSCDARNVNSMTFFSIKNTDVKSFIYKLRENPFVREVNISLVEEGGFG